MTWYERHPVALLVGVVIGVVALIFGIWGAAVVLAPLFGAGNAHIKTNSADYRIAAYDKFYDSCNDLLATQAKYNNAVDTLDSDTKAGASPMQLTVDRHNVQALVNSFQEDAASYNADASKSATKAQFLSSELPFNIPLNPKETFSCTS